jgi:peptidyl-prolyl cis-trans isomerase SurA
MHLLLLSRTASLCMKKVAFWIVLLLTIAPSWSVADTVVEEIIVRINNSIITRSELQRARDQLMAELRQRDPQNVDQLYAEREKDILRDLIDQQLLIQRGEELEITADNEVIRRLDEIRKNMKLETMEDLEKEAEKQGVSFEDFKLNLKNNIITQQVIGREVGQRLQITQEDVRQYYEEHKKEFEREEQVRLSEILVSTEPKQKPAEGEQPSEPDPKVLAAAENKAKELLAQLRSGAKFENLAQSQSDSPAASAGGDLGYFKRGTLSKELENITFAMKPGEITDVIRTRQGFVILKVTERHQAGIPPLNEVEREIQERIYLQRLQPSLREYLTKLREDAYIDIKEGYVDSAASPRQTKPIITTAAAEEEKPKKKKKRFLLF